MSADRSTNQSLPRRMALMPRRLIVMTIRLYQATLSHFLGRQCRFEPTCSQYAIEALEQWGAVRGGNLAIRRLLRCHPFSRKSGYDPVPPRR